MIRLIAAAAMVLAAACVDKVSEDGRSCPCGDGRACCFDVCVEAGESCDMVEATIGLGGGTVTAPNGATLEIPFGALEEDTVIRIRSIEPEPAEGVTFVGGAVVLEPEGLGLREGGGLVTLPFDVDRIPAGVDPGDVLVHRTLTGTRAYQRGEGTEVSATTMQVRVGTLMLHVPAVSQVCPYTDYSCFDSTCFVEIPVDDTLYRAECPRFDPEVGLLATCRCLEDGVEKRAVQAFDGFTQEVYRYECGFPCPDEAPPIMPDAGVPDAAPPT